MAQTQRVSGVATHIYENTGIDGKRTQIFYHKTCVVEFDTSLIVLRTGGWKTTTTKARMNQAANEFGLGYYVSQKKGEWFVSFNGETAPFSGDEFKFQRSTEREA